MSPRTLLLTLALTGLLACPGTAPADGPAADGPPDVLLLVMDTTRADRCSLLGYGRPTTPRLEEVAKEAVVFEDAWSASSWTVPAHAALFTGRMPESLGMLVPTTPVLPDGVPTLSGLLAAGGWDTACFTANPWISKATRLVRGFGTVDALYARAATPTAREAHARALAWMAARRKAGKRFFAFINDMEPHAPYDPPADVAAQFVDPKLPPESVADARTIEGYRGYRMALGADPAPEATLRAMSGLYDGEVAVLDREIGVLLDGMRAEGLLDRTLVVIAGDHGEGLAEHGWYEHGVYLYRELLHVPLLVRPPGGTPGRRVKDVVRLHDVFATILESCGLPVPAGVDSRPLLGDVSGRIALGTESQRAQLMNKIQEALMGPLPKGLSATRRSVYDGRHELIVDSLGGTWLFDVRADPGERDDLAATAPDVVERLRAKLVPPAGPAGGK